MILITLFYISYSKIESTKIINLFKDIDSINVCIALFLLVFHQLLASFRYHLLKIKSGSNLNYLQSYEVNIHSLVYKSFFFIPIFLEIMGRSTHAKFLGDKKFSNTVNITMIEKLSSLFSIFVILLILTVLQNDIFNFNTFYFVYYSIILLFIIFVSLVFYLLNLKFNLFRLDKLKTVFMQLIKHQDKQTIILSLIIHLTSIGALYFLLLNFYNQNSLFLLVVASFIIASQLIPLSINGWGTREITALLTLNYLDESSYAGVLCATIFGFLYLLALSFNWILNHFTRGLQKRINHKPTMNISSSPYYRLIIYFSSFFIFLLLPLNIFLPVEGANTKLSLADGLVFFFGLSVFVNWLLRRREKVWIGNHTGKIFIALFVMLIFGWVIGFLNFGSNSWASLNRLSGSIIILCYLFSGLGIMNFLKKNELDRFIYVFMICIFLSLFFQYSIVYILSLNSLVQNIPLELNILLNQAIKFLKWGQDMPTGFFLDKNSLCFSLIISTGYLLSKVNNNNFKTIDFIFLLISSLIIFVSSSRSAIFTLILLVSYVFIFQIHNSKNTTNFIKKSLFFLFILCVFYIIFLFYHVFNPQINTYAYFIDFTGSRGILDYFAISEHRLYLIMAPIKSFINNPIFGIGLGGFVDLSQNATAPSHCEGVKFPDKCEIYNIIHSSHLWVAAEFGLLGLIVYITFMTNMVYTLKKLHITDFRRHLLLNTLIIFFIFSFFHDIFYQRIFWLFLGLTLSFSLKDKKNLNIISLNLKA